MDIFIKASQLIMSLSILVVLHELGHFIPAKLFKTRVEKFYLFFDPWFSLVKKKIGDTEYGVGWLPLGGYVKISGMIDESMDKDQMKKPPETWEFRAKPAWQRLIIMLGGVFVNLILGVFIYSMTLFVYGDKYLANDDLTDGVWFKDGFALALGFENGDKILSADGNLVERFSEIPEKIITSKEVLVERDNIKTTIVLPNDVITRFIENESKDIVYPRIPSIVSAFSENSNCEKSGILINDQIIGINGAPIKYHDEVSVELMKNKNSVVSIDVLRKGKVTTINTPVSDNGTIGFVCAIPGFLDLEKLGVYPLSSDKYSLFASIPAGWNKAIKKLSSYINQFILILKPSTGAYKGLGGFGAIGSLFPSTWNWEIFWNLTAFLSLMLAFMNLLPIPALDGGHVVFLLYEIVVGKPAPEKFMEYAQVVGMILLLGLVFYANLNDVLRLF
jgi:regulator of sigma E protease